MKSLFLLFFSFAFSSVIAQNKIKQVRDYLYRYDSTTISAINFSSNESKWVELKTGATTLVKIYDDGLAIWDATLVAGNVSDTLSTTGITGICRITVPTTVNTQRIVQYGDWAIIYQTTSYTATFSDGFALLPLTIKRNSDDQVMCIIYNGFAVDWVVTPQWSWVGRVGTTRIKRITLP